MDAHQPDWRAGKTPAAVVYARSENGWFSWLIAELEAEINDPQARARRRALVCCLFVPFSAGACRHGSA